MVITHCFFNQSTGRKEFENYYDDDEVEPDENTDFCSEYLLKIRDELIPPRESEEQGKESQEQEKERESLEQERESQEQERERESEEQESEEQESEEEIDAISRRIVRIPSTRSSVESS